MKFSIQRKSIRAMLHLAAKKDIRYYLQGINANDIIPRENVFTYNAWLALNRQVRKGEKGVKVVTWIPAKDKNSESSFMLCRRSTVFHISQTDSIQ